MVIANSIQHSSDGLRGVEMFCRLADSLGPDNGPCGSKSLNEGVKRSPHSYTAGRHKRVFALTQLSTPVHGFTEILRAPVVTLERNVARVREAAEPFISLRDLPDREQCFCVCLSICVYIYGILSGEPTSLHIICIIDRKVPFGFGGIEFDTGGLIPILEG